MKYIFCLLLALSFISCDQQSEQGSAPAATVADTTAFEQKLQLEEAPVSLLPEADEITSEWLAYIIAQDEIQNLRNYSVREAAQAAEPLAEIMKNLMETAPPGLETNAVKARLAVLYTKAKVLEQQANQRKPDPEKIALVATQLVREFNNLKVQINEIFLRTMEDFDFEQFHEEGQTEELDTLLRVPLRSERIQ